MTVRRGLRFLAIVLGSAAELARQWKAQALYPDIYIDAGATLAKGVRLATFDGGSITIGDGAFIGRDSLIEAKGGHIVIGNDAYIQTGCVIVATERIMIGRDSLIAEYVTIRDQNHRHRANEGPYSMQGRDDEPVIIGSNVWLGAKCTVTAGVTIGDGAVVGCNAVVTRDLAPYGKYGGIPARELRASAKEGRRA